MPTLIDTRMIRLRRDAADVDDVVAVEHATPSSTRAPRRRAARGAARRSRAGVRLRQVRVAELEHARGERELLAVGADVAEVGEREQEAARGGAGEAGAAGDVGQRELGVLGAERADHREPALERLDEVLAAARSQLAPSVFWAIATALLAAGTPA